MLVITVDQNNKVVKVERSKQKGLFESEADNKYAKKITKKMKQKQRSKKWDLT